MAITRQTEAEAWLPLLIEHGYRPDQLIFTNDRPDGSADELAATVALVKPPCLHHEYAGDV